MAKDVFDITMLNPTASGGRTWTSNWHSSTRRVFNTPSGGQYTFPVTSGGNQDPQDSEFVNMTGGPITWYIDGTSGIAQWVHQSPDTISTSSPPSCRPYVLDIAPGIEAYEISTQTPARKTWSPNVEMTCYVKTTGWLPGYTAADNGSFVRLAGPGDHFNIINCNCDAVGYSINLLGYTDHAYAVLVHKEITHDTYGNPSDGVNVAPSHFTKTPSWTAKADSQRWPLHHWIGVKFIQRKITSSGYMRIEAYRDVQDGRFGGHWQKLADLTDDGILGHWGATVQSTKDSMDAFWATPGNCDNSPTNCIFTPAVGNYNPLPNYNRYSCYLRIQNYSNVYLKKFSIREIDPL